MSMMLIMYSVRDFRLEWGGGGGGRSATLVVNLIMISDVGMRFIV